LKKMLSPVTFVLGGNLQDGLLSCTQSLRGNEAR
jgi:hypothetical protein